MNLCPVKATMACTVRRSTMSVCLPLAKTTPPVGISSMPMSVSAHPSLKVCVCECIRICFRVLKVLPGELLKALFVCVHAGRHCEIYKDPCLKMRCLNGGRCESAGLNASCSCPPGYLGEHSLTTSCVFLWLWLVMKMNVAAWKMKSGCDPSASLWAVDVIAKKSHLMPPYLSAQGKNVRSTSMSATATLVTTEARASTNQMASPVTVHLGGWDPAARSVSHPVRKYLIRYYSK